MKSRLLPFGSILALLVLVPTSAAAQARPPEPAASSSAAPEAPSAAPNHSDDAAKQEAQEHFYKGLELFKQEAWAASLAEFLLSRKLHSTRAATKNAGLSLRKLGRFDESLDMFEALLREFSNPSEGERALVEHEIVELRALVGSIDVLVLEPSAVVLLDGRERGATPLSAPLRVSAGSHLVQIYKDGFVPFEVRLDVAGGQHATVDGKLRAVERSGRLSVTEQTGKSVDVLVDGIRVGKTPWEGRVAVGDHTVLLRGEGDLGTQPAVAPVHFDASTPLTLAVEPLESELRLVPIPIGASVAIDGVPVGRGTWLGRLRAGPHRIEVAAEGHLVQKRELSLRADEHEVATIELERDPSSPLWRSVNPARFVFDVHLGGAFGASLGGDLATTNCQGACSAHAVPGAMGVLHGAYQLGSGLGFGLAVGYLVATQHVDNRSINLNENPPGGTGKPHSGTVEDTLLLQGLLAGAELGYHSRGDWTWHLRFGAGVFIAGMNDSRSGTFDNPGTFSAGARAFANAYSLYLSPEARIGYRIAKRLEASFGVEPLILFALTQPAWPEDHAVTPNGPRFQGYFNTESSSGRVLFLVSPGLGLRLEL